VSDDRLGRQVRPGLGGRPVHAPVVGGAGHEADDAFVHAGVREPQVVRPAIGHVDEPAAGGRQPAGAGPVARTASCHRSLSRRRAARCSRASRFWGDERVR